jgi:hypothetical protein
LGQYLGLDVGQVDVEADTLAAYGRCASALIGLASRLARKVAGDLS